MAAKKTDIIVYADWLGLAKPARIGWLSVQQAKGRKAFSFAYENNWIQTNAQRLLDPDIQWYKGPQHPVGKENFGVFMDSMPDTWGRKLMLRRAALQAAEEGISLSCSIGKPLSTLFIDYCQIIGNHGRIGKKQQF